MGGDECRPYDLSFTGVQGSKSVRFPVNVRPLYLRKIQPMRLDVDPTFGGLRRSKSDVRYLRVRVGAARDDQV